MIIRVTKADGSVVDLAFVKSITLLSVEKDAEVGIALPLYKHEGKVLLDAIGDSEAAELIADRLRRSTAIPQRFRVTPRNLDDDRPCTSTNGFTIGKTYEARLNHNGRLLVVINDNGHERLVFTNGDGGAHLTIGRQHPRTAGRFEIDELLDAT